MNQSDLKAQPVVPPGSAVAQELSGTTPTANLLSGGVDEVFMRTDSSSSANFLADGLGSTLVLTDNSGNPLATYGYEAFGNTTLTSGSSDSTYQYTGRENDGTGLYFYRNRYYSPIYQTFISEDPLGFAGGINIRGYVANNPISFRDSFGLSPCGGGGGSAGRKGGVGGNAPSSLLGLFCNMGNYLPVICGGGVYYTGGFQLSMGAANVTYRRIHVADTEAGRQSGTFTELNFGDGIQGGLGQAQYSTGSTEDYLFGGLGLDLPTVTEVSVSGFVAHVEGEPLLNSSIGIDLDGGISVLGGSAAAYLNTESLTSCVDEHFN